MRNPLPQTIGCDKVFVRCSASRCKLLASDESSTSLSYCCDIADQPGRDERIGALIRNGLQEKKRSFFVVVGDQAKDVIVRLHYIMSMVDIKQNKSVLWAYKKKLLGFTR